MNERIKELAEQAGFMLWQDEPWNPGDVVDWSARYDDELAKFAELIVRQCALTAGLIENRKGRNIGAAILDHFEIPEDTKHIKYSAKYDAYYDEELNEWTEPKCSDPECEFCTNRPVTPL